MTDDFIMRALMAISTHVQPGEYAVREMRIIVEANGLELPAGSPQNQGRGWNSVIVEAQKRGLLNRTARTKRVPRVKDPRKKDIVVLYKRTERKLPPMEIEITIPAMPDDQAHAA